jgi:hypothetical protein
VTAVAPLAACSGGGGTEAGVPSLPELHGRVRVEISHGDAGTAIDLSARFLRYRDIDRATAELLAGGDPLLADGCQVPAGVPPMDDLLALLSDTARVEHLDAGEISTVYEGVAVATTPTRVAPMAPWVDGVEYDDQSARVAPESKLLETSRGDEVVIAGFGGQHVGPFEAALEVPAGRASAQLDGDLAVTWPPGADEIVVTFDGASGPVCRTVDPGGLRVPAALLPASDFTMSVARVRRVPLSAPGLPAGEIEVVVRDTLAVGRP